MSKCKNKKCTINQDDSLVACWNSDCASLMHLQCSKMLLDHHSIPSEEQPLPESQIAFCKKGCYGKWLADKKRREKADAKAAKDAEKKKRKVPWESDGSMSMLMDFLTTEPNYANYCGASGNKGTSKAQYHKQIAELLQQKAPDSERTAKDVENKINSLERQFRIASDWANNTGQGVDDPLLHPLPHAVSSHLLFFH